MISSRHRFAAGDWDAYDAQDAFEMTLDEELSRLVLPPELEAAVYLFRRRAVERNPPATGNVRAT